MTYRALTTGLLMLLAAAALAQGPKVPVGCTAAAGAKAGFDGYADRIIHTRTGLELVLIPPGSFDMGASVPGMNSDVYPSHAVNIAKPLYMGRTEVTNAAYRKFSETGYDGKKDVDPAYDLYLRHFRGKSDMPAGDEYPVVWMSWKNAKAFCDWAGLDLPSESEWEYACRAGTKTTFFFGDDVKPLEKYAWTDTNAKNFPHPVAQLLPNPWGLYDMAGNVWEWTLDDFVYRYDGAPADGSPRIEGKMTKSLRGGSWSDGAAPQLFGSFVRFMSAPGNASNNIGFRVVLRP